MRNKLLPYATGAALALAMLALVSCSRPAPTAAGPAGPQANSAQAAAAEAANPVVAQVDLSPLYWQDVARRLAELKGEPDAEVKAALMAASDVLVAREMGVVGQAPAPTETAAQAADRFLAQVWDGKRGCAVTEAELRLAYMQDLGSYKHPPSWTVWDLQSACCADGADCPLLEQEGCRQKVRPHLQKFADELRRSYPQLPALGLTADATEVALADSPLKQRHLPQFEEGAAALQASGQPVRLLRYTFWQQNVAGFEKAPFRRADPSVEKAAQKAKLGEVLGPFDGDDALHVAVVAARKPQSVGLPKAATEAEANPVALALRAKLCGEAAVTERHLYRQRLVQGARILWKAEALVGRIPAAAIDQLVKLRDADLQHR